MNTTRIKKQLTLAGLITTVGFVKPILNVNAADIHNYIENNCELHNYYDNVNIEDLLETLKENPYLNIKYKTYVKDFIEKVYNKYPNIDYTIFNQNLKDLKIIEKSKEEIEELRKAKNIKGYYLIYENKIYIEKNIKNIEYVLFHELWHAFTNLYIEEIKALKSPTYGFTYGTALEEGMATYLTNTICVDSYISYENQLSIVEMLIEIYGEEIIASYLDEGIPAIVYKLSLDSNYNLASNFIKIMDKELSNKDTKKEIIDIYRYLIDIYSKDILLKPFDSIVNFQKLITNLDYSYDINKENLNYLKENYQPFTISNEVKYAVFIYKQNKQSYLLDNIYVVRIENGNTYFVNANIIKEYLETGYIYNIYDTENVYYSKEPIIYSSTLFREFIEKNLVNFIDVFENKIYINTDSLNNKLYNEEETVKILSK